MNSMLFVFQFADVDVGGPGEFVTVRRTAFVDHDSLLPSERDYFVEAATRRGSGMPLEFTDQASPLYHFLFAADPERNGSSEPANGFRPLGLFERARHLEGPLKILKHPEVLVWGYAYKYAVHRTIKQTSADLTQFLESEMWHAYTPDGSMVVVPAVRFSVEAASVYYQL
jgi:hypothetical protein